MKISNIKVGKIYLYKNKRVKIIKQFSDNIFGAKYVDESLFGNTWKELIKGNMLEEIKEEVNIKRKRGRPRKEKLK